jgi:hypothetical protein
LKGETFVSDTSYAITVKWENRVRRLAKEYGYDPDFLIARFEEVMNDDGDIDYFVGVTVEQDW